MGDIIAIATAHLGARSWEAPLIHEGHQDEHEATNYGGNVTQEEGYGPAAVVLMKNNDKHCLATNTHLLRRCYSYYCLITI